jgi:hypothetical protein
MARAAHRDPTPRELDERLTRVERQVAEIATTITNAQEASVREAQQSRDAFIEHRAEVRKGFAEGAVRAEALRNDVAETHVIIHRLAATIEAGFKASFTQVADVRNELKADVAANRTELADLRNEMRAAFARLDAKLDRGPAE